MRQDRVVYARDLFVGALFLVLLCVLAMLAEGVSA